MRIIAYSRYLQPLLFRTRTPIGRAFAILQLNSFSALMNSASPIRSGRNCGIFSYTLASLYTVVLATREDAQDEPTSDSMDIGEIVDLPDVRFWSARDSIQQPGSSLFFP
jgi:hypothetical protein